RLACRDRCLFTCFIPVNLRLPAARRSVSQFFRGAFSMPRVKRGTKRRARRKKILKHTKGFFLTKSKLHRSAKEAMNRSLRYSYRDRRTRKRDYRTLWIQRIGAAARNNGISYSQFMHGLKVGGVDLDRKILADIAVHDAAAFTSLVAQAKQHLTAVPASA